MSQGCGRRRRRQRCRGEQGGVASDRMGKSARPVGEMYVFVYVYVGDFFFFNDTATTEIYTLSLHDALPISPVVRIDAYDPSDWAATAETTLNAVSPDPV